MIKLSDLDYPIEGHELEAIIDQIISLSKEEATLFFPALFRKMFNYQTFEVRSNPVFTFEKWLTNTLQTLEKNILAAGEEPPLPRLDK